MPIHRIQAFDLFEGDFIMSIETNEITCKFCNSPNLVKNGTRGGTQYWTCKSCGKSFVANQALPGMKYPVEDISSALYQFYTGTSLSEIRGHFKQQKESSPSDSTNKIERWHGTFKDRTKVMRGFKSPETANNVLQGWLVYYNYFRPHESLDGKTPAEVAKTSLPYKNWLDVVKSKSPLAQETSHGIIIRNYEVPDVIERPYRTRKKYPKRARRKRHGISFHAVIRPSWERP
jgi:transposase-like protein